MIRTDNERKTDLETGFNTVTWCGAVSDETTCI